MRSGLRHPRSTSSTCATTTRHGWDHTPPAPASRDVIAGTRARYVDAYERLTGARFDDWYGPPDDRESGTRFDRRRHDGGSIGAVQYEARIEVTQRPGCSTRKAPRRACAARSRVRNVRDVQIGKCIRLVVDAPDRDAARADVEAMCERLLANPVIEAYDIELTELASSG